MRQTTNYGLKITEGNDDWRNIFDDNAHNMEAIDDAIAPMTGATVSADGTSGVVPEPESGDQNKFLKGDASWAIPGVMTVNGRSPDASGNITVIEGGGSSSYGSYRLDATIPVSSWTGDGPYVATVSNQYITANMDGTETWLDDETAMLGDTTFTTSDGLLTISTTEKPAAAWGLHIALAVNGADVLADISNIREDVDDNTTAITGLSTNKAYQITIANADAIATVYNKLNELTNGTTATIYIGGTAMSNLTNSAYSSAATGTVGKVTSSNYRFNLLVGNNTPVQIDQSGMSSSSWGTSTITDVSSTLGHGTAITASSLSALKTNLLSVANKADVNGFIAVKITPSFTSDGFTSGANYGGHIYNIYKSNGSTTYFSAIVSNNLGEDVLIGYSNGTWYFNSPKKNIDTLNSKTTPAGFDFMEGEKVSSRSVIGTRVGKLCIISGFLSLNAQLSKGDVIATLSVSATNPIYRFIFTKNDGSGTSFLGKLNANNQIVVDGGQENTGSDQYYLFDLVFFAD